MIKYITCGDCKYWDRKYVGLCSDTYKPCTHPNRPRNIDSIGETRYSEDRECAVQKAKEKFGFR